MTFKSGDTSSLDPIWSIYGVLDVTPEGRGDRAAFPNLQYSAGRHYLMFSAHVVSHGLIERCWQIAAESFNGACPHCQVEGLELNNI